MSDPQPDLSTRNLLIKLAAAAVLIGGLVVFTINFSTFTPKPAPQTPAAPAANQSPRQSVDTPRSPAAKPTPSSVTSMRPQEVQARQAALSPQPTLPILTDYQHLIGTRYTPRPAKPQALPDVTVIDLRLTPQSYAVWGAIGQDDRGQIFVGVSTDGRGGSSSQLIQYDPVSRRIIDRGMVLDQLRQHRLYQDGMGQAKIHSRIVLGSDGYLYFSSKDEEGETADGSQDPIYGSFLWRTRGPDYAWEPLFKSPKALIAIAGFGSDIYALGYFDHHLYHLNTRTGRHDSVKVGSIQGHISRNFIVDSMGNAYVPRVRPGLLPNDPPAAELVQYTPQLNQVAITPLDYYLTPNPADSHGIISYVQLADRSIIFATHFGRLYRIIPSPTPGRPAKVEAIGWFHPQGPCYTPTMHTIDGSRYLVGVAKTADNPPADQPAFEWLVYDLWLNQAAAQPLHIPPPTGHGSRNLLLYGSLVRDMSGDFYIAGTHLNARMPLLVKLSLPR